MCTWTSLLGDMGTPLTHVVQYWCPVLVRTGARLRWAAWVLRACSCHTMASGSHFAMTGTVRSFGRVVQGALFAEGHESDERICDFVGACLGRPWGVPGAAW